MEGGREPEAALLGQVPGSHADCDYGPWRGVERQGVGKATENPAGDLRGAQPGRYAHTKTQQDPCISLHVSHTSLKN